MKQVVQNIGTGKLSVVSTLPPMVQPGCVLIQARRSLISAGTEKAVRALAQKSLLAKAKSRPDHVRRILEKVRQEGLKSTISQVREKLDEPMPLGYCSAGVVLACGEGVQEYQPGDLVASNAPHAELACVPKNLCARIPDGVSLEEAAFTVLGSIALQGVRLSRLVLGETALVIGLGLVGQITVALLKAAGVRVIGTDLDAAKCELAKKMGAAVAMPGIGSGDVEQFSQGLGADAVLITASTESNAPIELAANAVRQKGRIVLVGVVSLNLDRRPFYFKEAEFVVSCSYGPGRYDSRYEEGGIDYPAGYVRWTEQRNLQAILNLMSEGKLDLKPLISHRFSIDRAEEAYQLLETGSESYLGVILEYPEETRCLQRQVLLRTQRSDAAESVGIGCLGAGNFARAVLLPKLSSLPHVRLETLCSSGGLSATHSGKKLGFRSASSDEAAVYHDPAIDAVVIATRHCEHARQVMGCIRAGKHVFVEKPLCLSLEELNEIEAALSEMREQTRILMIGFNRRFSPAAKTVKAFFSRESAPLTISVRFNAGLIPAEHWTQDATIGGGRIIGEACHAIDLAIYLAGSPVERVFAESIGGAGAPKVCDDQCFITLRHENGSVSSVAYLAGGEKSFPKERIEVMGGGKVAVIDDFRSAEAWAGGRRKRLWKGPQDKGHLAELAAFVEAVRNGGDAPISWSELRSATLASIFAVRSLREGEPVQCSHPAASMFECAPEGKIAG